MQMLFLTGDISGGDWAQIEFGTTPWDDPAYFHEISPLTYADGIRTPLLIQHSERDIRTTVGQAEALFTVLRSKKRPVRLMRVPEETHELTALRDAVPPGGEPRSRSATGSGTSWSTASARCRRCRRSAPGGSPSSAFCPNARSPV